MAEPTGLEIVPGVSCQCTLLHNPSLPERLMFGECFWLLCRFEHQNEDLLSSFVIKMRRGWDEADATVAIPHRLWLTVVGTGATSADIDGMKAQKLCRDIA
jgi:hypothetical protein